MSKKTTWLCCEGTCGCTPDYVAAFTSRRDAERDAASRAREVRELLRDSGEYDDERRITGNARDGYSFGIDAIWVEEDTESENDAGFDIDDELAELASSDDYCD